jgi:Yip1 domain
MSATLQQRVVGILSNPQSEWPAIAVESDTIQGLYTRYIIPLAAIGAVALFLRFPGLGTLMLALVGYGVQLAVPIICAVLIAWLAPRFKSSGDNVQALKMVAYASTPAWLAAVARLVPFLYPLVALVAGLYAIYLFYLGLTSVMKTPDEQRVPFMLVSAILVIVVFTLFSFSITVMGIGAIAGLSAF